MNLAGRSCQWLVVWVAALLWVPEARADRCGEVVTDADQIASVRAQIESVCDCEGANSRREYVGCAREIVATAEAAGELRQSCARMVMRCASRSTCGKPGAVTCCRTTRRGAQHCSIKRSPAKCIAPSGGTACVGQVSSCCDACGSGGACITRTPTPTPTPTSTPTPPGICESLVNLPRLATVPMTLEQGTLDCGGPALSPPAAAPFSGQINDINGNKLADLGLGCLYVGSLPPLRLPSGSVTKLDVVGVNLASIQLAASAGSGNQDCTQGALETRHCLNGRPGTDGNGTCTSDSDCGGAVTSCSSDARCFFGPPLAVSDPLPICIVSAFQRDLCGAISLLDASASLTTELSSRVYLTGNAETPCPLCVDGTCTAGKRAGQACVAAASGTSPDCPPLDSSWLATLPIGIPELTSGTSQLVATDGIACPGQALPGMFGNAQAARLTQTGSSPIGSTEISMNLVAAFCSAASGSVLDPIAGLPGPITLSTRGSVDLSGLIGLPGIPSLPLP